MDETSKYKLKKPSPDDYVDVEVLNGNMDIIDFEMIKVFVQEAEPSQTNCIWIEPIGERTIKEDIVLEMTEEGEGKYFVDVEGEEELKKIQNVVDSEEEMTPGTYSFEIL